VPKKKTRPPQQQARRPGREGEMKPQPKVTPPEYKGSGKLDSKVAVITGGDSGIGRAVAVLFAREGADVLVTYLNEHKDAEETKRLVEKEGRRCVLVDGDIGEEHFCQELVSRVIEEFGQLDIVVNNAAEQHPQDNITQITAKQLERTFELTFSQCFTWSRPQCRTSGRTR
jgi:NAD(P)-dependent dehydrogenase (short-subunit alcohol dehydrogenase family)